MTTRTGIAVTLSLLFAGCASGAGSGDVDSSVPRARDRPPEVSASGDVVYVDIQPERIISMHLISAPMERVWYALARAYEDLGIPITVIDRPSGVLGNSDFKARLMISQVPITELLDCGFGPAGPHAALNRITINIRSQIRPADEGKVELRTLILATADPAEGVSNRPVSCTTTGALEDLIAKRTEAALAGLG